MKFTEYLIEASRQPKPRVRMNAAGEYVLVPNPPSVAPRRKPRVPKPHIVTGDPFLKRNEPISNLQKTSVNFDPAQVADVMKPVKHAPFTRDGGPTETPYVVPAQTGATTPTKPTPATTPTPQQISPQQRAMTNQDFATQMIKRAQTAMERNNVQEVDELIRILLSAQHGSSGYNKASPQYGQTNRVPRKRDPIKTAQRLFKGLRGNDSDYQQSVVQNLGQLVDHGE